MTHIITLLGAGIILVFATWIIAAVFIKRYWRNRINVSSDDDETRYFREMSFSWAISLACIILTGLSLITLGLRGSSPAGGQIMSFLYMFGGTVCAAVFLPLIWLMVRNKQLEAEIIQRKIKELELEEANTRLSRALEELRVAQGQLVESERMKALGEMAAGIVHDFNNCLMPIIGLSGIMLSDRKVIENPDEVHELLTELSEAARDARELVRRLTNFYRNRDEMPHEPVDINQIVTGSVSLTRQRWHDEKTAKGQVLEVGTTLAPMPAVMGNESQLREALINLIINAVDAIPESGAVALRTFADSKWATIEVSDTGAGMTEEAQRRCLEPFFTTKVHGSGLGLSMVLGIIRRHNGEIEVKSEQGKGTTIILRLPVGTGTPAAGDASEGKDPPVKPLRVLVVDDNPRVQNTVRRFLEAGKHAVETAGTGTEGLAKLRTATFDLLIVDRAMPDMSGDEMAKAVRQAHPDMRIVMLTGFGAMLRDAQGMPPGVDAVLAKPVSYRELVGAIAELAAKKDGGSASRP